MKNLKTLALIAVVALVPTAYIQAKKVTVEEHEMRFKGLTNPDNYKKLSSQEISQEKKALATKIEKYEEKKKYFDERLKELKDRQTALEKAPGSRAKTEAVTEPSTRSKTETATASKTKAEKAKDKVSKKMKFEKPVSKKMPSKK